MRWVDVPILNAGMGPVDRLDTNGSRCLSH